MSGRNIGHVEFIVDFDGDNLPRQARQIGNRAGKEMGEGLDKGADEHLTKFGQRLRDEMRESGRDAGKSFNDEFDRSFNKNLDDTVREVHDVFTRDGGFGKFADDFDQVGDASDDLDRKLIRLHETGRITDQQFLDMVDSQREFVRSARETEAEAERVRTATADLGDEISRLRNERLIQTTESFQDLNRELDTSARRFAIARGEVDEFHRVFGGDSDREIRDYADRMGIDLPRAFDHYLARMDSVKREFPSFAREIDNVRIRAGNLHEELGVGRSRFQRITDSMRRFTLGGNESNEMLRRLGRSIRDVNTGLPNLSHGLRQGIFYTGLFTALAPGIAVLGSVAGSGLFALATGAGALGIAIAAMIPGFKGMLDDVDKLPPKARGAAKAMQDFAEPLGEMQDLIQENMFDGLGDEIDSLRQKTLPALTRGMGKTATTLNGIFDDMLTRLTSRRGIGRLNRIFNGLQPILDDLGGSALDLGAAFSAIFEDALPSGQGFFSFLQGATRDFNAWVNDKPGRDALAAWFEHLGQIMPGVGDLIASAGRSVAGLVTDKAISNMQAFLSNTSNALPDVVGGLGDLIDALDPLGLASEALAGIGGWFAKNSSGVKDFGNSAHDFVTSVGGQFGDLLGTIGDELLNISPGILNDVGSGISSVGKAINSPEGKKAIESLGTALSSAGEAVGDLLTDLADSGAITEALEAIGKAAEVASKGIELFNDGNKAINGDLDIPGGKDGEKAIENYMAGGKKAWKQGWSDFWSLDPKEGERLLRAWGFNGGLAAGDGAKDGIDKKKGDVKKKGAELGGSFADGVDDSGSKAKVVAAAGGLSGGFLQGVTNAFDKNSGAGNVIGGFVGRIFGKTDQDGKAQKAGAGMAETFKVALGSGFGAIGDLGSSLASTLGNLFGGHDGEAKTKGSGTGTSFAEGVKSGAGAGGIAEALGNLFNGDAGKGKAKAAGEGAKQSYISGLGESLGDIGQKLGEIFAGDAGKTAAGSAGEAAGLSYGTGVGNGLPTAGEKFDQLFGGDAGKTAAGTAGGAAGTSFVGGLNVAVASSTVPAQAGTNASNQLVTPFASVPGRIQTNLAPLPGAVGGVMGGVSGQLGADNAANPFAAVPGRVRGNISGTPGAVGGVMGQVTGQRGADNTANPFNSVIGRIQGYVAGTPGVIAGIMGSVTGQRGADNTVNPFNGVPGRVGGHVSGVAGAVSGALSGISDFGAAGRIIGAFQGVTGAVRSALSGLGGVVQAALAGARGALAGGVASIRSSLPQTATGGLFNSAQARIIGEAGPEAVVPLNRPLARVDPAVRDLSALAQGKTTRGNGPTYGTYVAEGAVQVAAENSDPRLVAAATVDRIVASAIG